jgi:SAM-dependent methyltransferase
VYQSQRRGWDFGSAQWNPKSSMTNRPAGFFDGTEMPTAGWWEALWPDPAGVLESVGLGPGMTVVDLCSGDGWFTAKIAKVARHVIAIDIDATLLEVSRQRLKELGITNCDFVAGDAYQLRSLVGQSVDFVFLANAFHGVPDRPRLASAVAETLRPGGLFAVVNWHPRPREQTTVLGEPRGPRTELRMPPKKTIEDCEAGSLSLARVVEVPPYHYGAVFANQAK